MGHLEFRGTIAAWSALLRLVRQVMPGARVASGSGNREGVDGRAEQEGQRAEKRDRAAHQAAGSKAMFGAATRTQTKPASKNGIHSKVPPPERRISPPMQQAKPEGISAATYPPVKQSFA